MISEADAQASVDYLFESAQEAAQARANRAVLEQGLKRVKALEMAAKEGALGAREMHAYASESYQTALDGLKEAIFADEKLRALRDAHDSRIRAWQTQQATIRSVRI